MVAFGAILVAAASPPGHRRRRLSVESLDDNEQPRYAS